jgi:type IV secretion system protein VirB6
MDESAPITWLIARINTIVSSGAAATASALATTITPLVAVCFGIYILLITISYMRGSETEPVLDFALRCVGFSLVIGLGLNAANYTSVVMPIVTGLGGDLANAASGGGATANTLDQLALHYLKIISDGYETASMQPFPGSITSTLTVVSKVAIILLGLIPFLVAATLAIVIADVGSLMVAMVGPIFFACLLFPATRQYFSSWVNTAFSYALIPLFVAVVAVISVGISKEMLSSGGTLLDSSYTSIFLAAIGNLTLLFVLRQVSALASSLSAGGINAAMPGGVGSMASSVRESIRGSARDIKTLNNLGKGMHAAGRAITNRRNSIRKAG